MNHPALTAEQKRRHEELYARPDMLPFEWNWLDERMAAGRHPLTAVDVAELAQAGITHILDLRREEEWCVTFPGREALEYCAVCGLKRFNWPLTNVDGPRLEDFVQTSAWIEDALQDSQAKVYIHCRAGMERTGTIVTAFFARRGKQSFEAALGQLKEKRPIFQPLPHQQIAVCDWLKNLESTSSWGL